MDEYESLSHSAWECKYHVVFIPKYRRKTMYAELRRHLGEVFRRLAEQKESRIEEELTRIGPAFVRSASKTSSNSRRTPSRPQ